MLSQYISDWSEADKSRDNGCPPDQWPFSLKHFQSLFLSPSLLRQWQMANCMLEVSIRPDKEDWAWGWTGTRLTFNCQRKQGRTCEIAYKPESCNIPSASPTRSPDACDITEMVRIQTRFCNSTTICKIMVQQTALCPYEIQFPSI